MPSSKSSSEHYESAASSKQEINRLITQKQLPTILKQGTEKKDLKRKKPEKKKKKFTTKIHSPLWGFYLYVQAGRRPPDKSARLQMKRDQKRLNRMK